MDIFFTAVDYMRGRTVYPVGRRVLNLLFNVSISSFFFEWIYGPYVWYDYHDYKRIADFFVKGHFFIPFSIFIILHAVTYYVPLFIFELKKVFKTQKWIRKVIMWELKKEEANNIYLKTDEASKYIAPSKVNFEDLYRDLKSQVDPKMWESIQNGMKRSVQNLEHNFCFAFRGLVAITVYFISIPQFGWLLYLTVFVLLVLSMVIMLYAACFFTVLPTLVRKMAFEVERYFEKQNQF